MKNKEENNVIENNTCFNMHEKMDLNCLKATCRCWFNNPESHNCINIATSRNGSFKQEIIGDFFGLTRMRVCQIEKTILHKIRTIEEIKNARDCE